MESVSDPLTWDDLLRYHREIFLPDFKAILKSELSGLDSSIESLRNVMIMGFEGMHIRFDRLEAAMKAVRDAADAHTG